MQIFHNYRQRSKHWTTSTVLNHIRRPPPTHSSCSAVFTSALTWQLLKLRAESPKAIKQLSHWWCIPQAFFFFFFNICMWVKLKPGTAECRGHERLNNIPASCAQPQPPATQKLNLRVSRCLRMLCCDSIAAWPLAGNRGQQPDKQAPCGPELKKKKKTH